MPTAGSRRTIAILALAGVAISWDVAKCVGEDDQLRAKAKELFGIIEAPAESRLGVPEVALGRALFWDTRISADGKTACASCHLAKDHGADRRTFSVDAQGRMTKRNSQTVFNATHQPFLRWTGNRKSGAEQAERSLTGSMGLASREEAVELLKELGYEDRFRKAFPDAAEPVSTANYGRAIEAYEQTLTTPSAFDKFLAGDDKALTAKQKTGLREFINTGCADCHSGPLLGGDTMQKFGLAKDYWTATGSEKMDLGRFDDTQKEADRYVFRVSMLRNIAETGPYFHDGSVVELSDAVKVMAEVQLGTELADDDRESIVEFLNALTGEVPKHYSSPNQENE